MYTYGTSVVNEYERELDGSYSVNEQLEKISDRVQSTFLTAAVFKYVVAYQEGSQYRITFLKHMILLIRISIVLIVLVITLVLILLLDTN